jgi:hypothetical protein
VASKAGSMIARPLSDQRLRHKSSHLPVAARHTGDNAATTPVLLIRF